MKQRIPVHDNRRNLRRSFLSCLLAAMIVLSLLPASTLAAKAEEGLIYTITLVAGDPGYLYDEYGTPVYQKALEFDRSAIVLDVPVYPEGYTFTGWYLDSACTMQAVYDPDTMVFVPAEQDTVLYAGCLAPTSEPVMEPELTLEPVQEPESVQGLESESVQGLTPETTPALVEEEPEQSLEPDFTEEDPAEESVSNQDGTEEYTEEAAQAQDISGMSGEAAEELAGTADEQTGTDVTEAGQPSGEQTGTDMTEAGQPAGEGPILITEDTADPANPQEADADDLPELIVQEEAAVEVASDEKQNDLLEEEYTAEENEAEELETEAAPEGIIYVDETLDIDTSGLEDNEVLFEKYVDRVFSGQDRIRLRGVPRYNLNAKSLEVLNALKVIAGKVASGSRTSTQIVFGADPDAKIDTSITWTYEELGITESSSSEEVSAAVKAALKTSIDSSAILDYLLADCPYDMYWFAKSEWGAFRQSYGYRPGEDTITLTGLTYYFKVDSNYKGDADYAADAAKTGAASSAAAYANSIVAAAASLSDYEKLVYYRQEICRLVSYNDAAAKNDYSGSLDPWQLIYVFDQNSDTNVVCEGYSKAFQYLCDCTTFSSSEIYCISVTGTMSGGTGAGGHMWNIVHMDDGNFYYVDVTNCDTGTIGADDKLFLAGTSGSSAEGYVFDFSSAYSTNTVGYVYDSTAWSVYGEPYLTIAGSNYVPKKMAVITLHADPQGYFLCDDGNGGQTEKDTLSRTIPAGQSVTVAELLDGASVCVRETYAVYFNENWYTSETEQNESTRVTAFTAEQNMDLYAGYSQGGGVTFDAGEEGYFDIHNEGDIHTISYSWNPGTGILPYYMNIRPKVMEGIVKAFTGWYYDEARTQRVHEEDRVEIKENMTLYAGWDDAWEIRYHANGGYFYGPWNDSTGDYDESEIRTDNVLKGNTTTGETRPNHADNLRYSFEGWMTSPDDEEGTVHYRENDEFLPTGDMDLYAMWSYNYEIKYDPNGGYFEDPEFTEPRQFYSAEQHPENMSSDIENGEAVFLGWSRDKNAAEAEDLTEILLDRDITLYAVWTMDYHTVTLDAGEGTFGSSNILTKKIPTGKAFGDFAGNFGTPSVDNPHKTFAGWSKEGSSVVISSNALYSYVPAKDETFYAVWEDAWMLTLEANDPDAYFRYDNTTQIRTVTVTVPEEEGTNEADLSAYTPRHKTDPMQILGGWNTEPDGSGTGYAVKEAVQIISDMILHAQWEQGCKVIFHAGDDGYFSIWGVKEERRIFRKGQESGYYFVPDVNNSYHKFLGWALEENGEVVTESFDTYVIPDQDTLELWAVYEDVPYKQINITFKFGQSAWRKYGSTDIHEMNYIGRKAGISLSDLHADRLGAELVCENDEEPYQAFKGWSLTEDGDVLPDDYVLTETTTLFAVWGNAYKITFDAGEGRLKEPGKSTYSFVLPQINALQYFQNGLTPSHIARHENVVPPKDKAFAGWSEDPSGSGTLVEVTDDWIPEKSMTLYAVYDDFAMHGRPAKVTAQIGDRKKLLLYVEPASAAAKTSVTWESEDASIAAVDNEGRITALKPGQTTITATGTCKGKTLTAVYTVIVRGVPVEGITLNKTSEVVDIGESLTLTASVLPDNATVKDVAWSSSDEEVAVVDVNGVVTAVGAGSVTITATTKDGGYTASCLIRTGVPVTGVKLNRTAQTIAAGKTAALTATVSPADATNRKVTWKSSDTTVATVSAKGVVTAKKAGTATITVTTEDGKKTAACKVTVTQPVTGVKLNKTSQTIVVGRTAALTAAVSPANASNKKVTWKSSNTAAVTVSAKGVVTAKKAGTAMITVTTEDGKKTATCKITVTQPVTGVKLNKTAQTIMAGKTAALTATVSPANASNKKVTWKSSNTAAATVSAKGVVTAKKAGTATITVTTEDGKKTATCKITVRQPVTGVKLNKTRLTMGNGQSFTLKATVLPSNAANKKVTWKSSNTELATVSRTGKVTTAADASGTVKITATTADGKKVAACSITVMRPSVLYRTHVQSYGWQNYVKDGALSGTSGLGKRLEGINIQLSNLPYSGSVVYRTHVQSYGWQSWKKDGEMSGTSGEAKRLEGIQIYLTGGLAKHYDVYYRVHAQTYGWLDYAKNGVMAGTSGLAKRLEAINIVLVPKGGKVPGSTARPYVIGGGGSLPENPYKG